MKNKILIMLSIFLVIFISLSYAEINDEHTQKNLDKNLEKEITQETVKSTSIAATIPTPKPPKPISDHNMIKDLSEGMLSHKGEYATDLFSGSATYSYAIEAPPGVNGLEPGISVSYNHHQTALKGILGNAWSLSQSYIYRDTNGTLSNIGDDVFKLHFNGIDMKLIYISSENSYHTETETYLKIEKKTGAANTKGEYWTLKTTDGTIYRFGYNGNSEFVSNQESFVSMWSLDLITDTHNNKIYYSYNENPSSDNYPYLMSISYNNGINLIKFNYDLNIFNGTNGYFYGTEIRQNALLNNVEVRNSGNLVRRYKFEYQTTDYKKFLNKIKVFGSDDISQLPSTEFNYYSPAKGWTQNTNYNLPSETYLGDSDDNGVRLIDINGDGYDDIIKMNSSNNMEYWLNNKNNGWQQKQVYSNILEGGILSNDRNDVGVRFFDINGDAKIDIVKLFKNETYSIRKILFNTGNGWQEKIMAIPSEINFIMKSTIEDSCIPSGCPSGYSDGGITCKQGICNRSCYILECYDTFVSRATNSSKVYFRTFDLSYGNQNCWSGAGGWLMFSGMGFCGQECAVSACPGGSVISNFPKSDNDTYATRISKEKICITKIYRNSYGQAIATSGRIFSSSCSQAIITGTPTEPYKSDGRETYGEHCGDGICMNNEIGACPNITLSYTYNDQQCGYFPSQYNDTGIRLADVNGDGKTDIIKLTEKEKKVWINTGDAFTLTNFSIPTEAIFVNTNYNSDEGTRIADVNGDGLPDLVKGKDTTRITWINNGKGWVQNTKWTIPSGAVFIANGQDKGVVFVDINGDGLVDMLRADNSIRKAFINTGSGWSEYAGWTISNQINFVGFSSTITDINGDGLADLIMAKSSDNKTTLVNNAQKNYLLKSIKNTYGGTISISYTKISSINNTRMDGISGLPFSGWVVDSITLNNSLSGNNQVLSITKYNYSGGLYDSDDKEFRGFNYVEETLSDSKIKHYFYQDKAKKGFEYKSTIFDNNQNPYFQTENEWISEQKNGYYIIRLNSTKEYAYDSQFANPKVTQESYNYDGYGNIIKLSSLGDLNLAGDEKYSYFEYIYNIAGWIADKLKHVYSLDSSSTKIRESWYNYDNLNNVVVKGDLTKKEEWLNGGINPVTTYAYDSYGNIISETDPNSHIVKYTYDPTHTFIIKEVNAKNQEFNYQYDLGTGNLLSEKDPNNYITTYKYDIFGRRVKEILPYDTESYPTIQIYYEIDGFAPEKIKIIQREENGTSKTYDAYYYYDGFGNLVQEKSESENTQFITKNTYYNEKGLIKEEVLPYYTATSDFSTGTAPSLIYFYDISNRIIKITNPDNTQKTINYNKWLISAYDENNHRTDYFQDAYGNIVEVKEYNGTSIHTTTYKYDSADELVEITDNQGNKIKYYYDSLDRKTRVEDLDLGMWQYSYDKAGNLIRQIDSKGNNLSLEYDELNRVTKKVTKEKTTTYEYDKNIKGLLSSVKDTLLVTNYTYDSRLRIIKEDKIVDSALFSTTFNYDSMDRLTSIKLPNGKIVNYTYNTQNELDSINGFLNNINYNALGQPVMRHYTNNVQTILDYNSQNFSLINIKTADKQNLNYLYDKKGNIIQIKDLITNTTSSFSYDDLDRLIKAIRTGLNNYNLNYTYDSIGNLLKISNKNLSTEFIFSTKPIHAPINVNQKNPSILCYTNSDCGINGLIGSPTCSNNDSFQNYRTYTCNNPGTNNASCSYSDNLQLKQDCGEDYCGDWGRNYCVGDDVRHNRICYDKGCSLGICFNNTNAEEQLVENCSLKGGMINLETESASTSNSDLDLGKNNLRGQTLKFSQEVYAYKACFYGRYNNYNYARDINLAIYSTYNGLPKTKISEVIIPKNQVTSSYQLICGNFTNPLKLNANVSYAFVISSINSTSSSAYKIRRSGDSNPYLYGDYVYSTNYGSSWSSGGSSKDLYFAVYGGIFENYVCELGECKKL